MQYIKADKSHAYAVASLALLLWPDYSIEYRMEDAKIALLNDNNALFLCFDGGQAIGFAQLSLRHDYVEGTDGGPVGYLEGIYVLDDYRHQGIARNLVRLGEQWAKERGCIQMASDCELMNAESLAFHLGCGFAEANRIICFVKDINAGQDVEQGA